MVLVYHRVGAETSLDGLTLARHRFVQQMEHLRRHCAPARLEDLVDAATGGRSVPHRAVAVTFDDGYRDTFTEAFPVLRHLGIPATVFLTTGYLDARRRDAPPMLSWRMVQAMQRAGVDFGSHTVSHPNLAECSASRVREELTRSKFRIEQALAEPITLLAYPYGTRQSVNAAIQRCARQVGYRAACTTRWGRNGPETDPFLLRRITPFRNEVRHFTQQLATALEKTRGARGPTDLHGVTRQAAGLWRTRYGWIGRHLKGAGVTR